MIYKFEKEGWQKPENMHTDYVPPIVAEGKLSATMFWAMAAHNQRIAIQELEDELRAAKIRLLYARDMVRVSELVSVKDV
jgi:hypothetical protein